MTCSGGVPADARRASRAASASVLPKPAGPVTSIAPPPCSITRRCASVGGAVEPAASPSIRLKLASDSAQGSGTQPSSMTAVARRQTQQPDAQPSGDALAADWIGACRRIVEAHRELFAEHRGIAARTVYAGIGEGGDRSLAIDRQCEDIVFAELETLHDQGHAFTAISEERGEVTFGEPGSPVSVIVDPLDGSLNARRMLPSHSLSIAIATGPTMADVEFGYVYDFGASEEYSATRGKQAMVNGEALRARGARLWPRGGRRRVGQAGADGPRARRP